MTMTTMTRWGGIAVEAAQPTTTNPQPAAARALAAWCSPRRRSWLRSWGVPSGWWCCSLLDRRSAACLHVVALAVVTCDLVPSSLRLVASTLNLASASVGNWIHELRCIDARTDAHEQRAKRRPLAFCTFAPRSLGSRSGMCSSLREGGGAPVQHRIHLWPSIVLAVWENGCLVLNYKTTWNSMEMHKNLLYWGLIWDTDFFKSNKN